MELHAEQELGIRIKFTTEAYTELLVELFFKQELDNSRRKHSLRSLPSCKQGTFQGPNSTTYKKFLVLGRITHTRD